MALSRPWAQFKAGSVTWWINRDFDSAEVRTRLQTPEQLMAPPAKSIMRDSAPRNTEVARAEWDGLGMWFMAQYCAARQKPLSAREFERACRAHL